MKGNFLNARYLGQLPSAASDKFVEFVEMLAFFEAMFTNAEDTRGSLKSESGLRPLPAA